MTDPGEAYAALLMAIRDLGDDELRIMVALADRIQLGRQRYGEWKASTDQRDYLRERHEELLDAAIYGAMHDVACTIPCPPPVPQLENGTRMYDPEVYASIVPDDTPTDKGS